MIVNQFLKCIKNLQESTSIEIGIHGNPNDFELSSPSNRSLERRKESLKNKANIILSENDLDCFRLSSISIGWDSNLSINDTVLRGGFTFNGITDALLFSTDYFKGTENVSSAVDYTGKLNWFEHLPEGIDDSMRGCFIKKEGNFPPPIVFFYGWGEWYTELDFDYYKYIELLFENYGFKGWQFFYIDITSDIPKIEDVLEDMRVAVKTLPLLFPNKDWSYHEKRYQETLDKLK